MEFLQALNQRLHTICLSMSSHGVRFDSISCKHSSLRQCILGTYALFDALSGPSNCSIV